jgi:hypothetical protein
MRILRWVEVEDYLSDSPTARNVGAATLRSAKARDPGWSTSYGKTS